MTVYITLSQLVTLVDAVLPHVNDVNIGSDSKSQGINYNTSIDTDSIIFNNLASLNQANCHSLSFYTGSRFKDALIHTQAAGVLLKSDDLGDCPKQVIPIVVDDPYWAYGVVSEYFEPLEYATINVCGGRHPTAIIAASACLAADVTVGAYAVIEDNVTIGAGSEIGTHTIIKQHTHIEQNCLIDSHVFIAPFTQIGSYSCIHAHASIGNSGFGFAPSRNPATQGWQRIAQLGRVIIGEHVRIGSHTCIDRGALKDTVIADHVIIDNLVQIAHNVEIGAGTAIAACAGIAGSTTLGQRCLLGGGSGITGHLEIGDDIEVLAMSRITKSINKKGKYASGTPTLPVNTWRRAAIKFKHAGLSATNSR